MKVLAVIDSFKGTITSKRLGELTKEELRNKNIECDYLSISDGGEGFLDAISNNLKLNEVIVNVSDPSTRVTVSGVKVELVNTEVLIENEYIYEVIEGNVIEVSVRGPRTIVENLEAADFKATARVALMSDTAKIEVICVDGI